MKNYILISNFDINMFIEPNTDDRLMRFAIINKKGNRVKFLHNDKIYAIEEVKRLSPQKHLYIERGDPNTPEYKIKQWGRASFFRKEELCDLYTFIFSNCNSFKDIKSDLYSPKQIREMIDVCRELSGYGFERPKEYSLSKVLEVEKQFISIQVNAPIQTKATAEYLDF